MLVRRYEQVISLLTRMSKINLTTGRNACVTPFRCHVKQTFLSVFLHLTTGSNACVTLTIHTKNRPLSKEWPVKC